MGARGGYISCSSFFFFFWFKRKERRKETRTRIYPTAGSQEIDVFLIGNFLDLAVGWYILVIVSGDVSFFSRGFYLAFKNHRKKDVSKESRLYHPWTPSKNKFIIFGRHKFGFCSVNPSIFLSVRDYSKENRSHNGSKNMLGLSRTNLSLTRKRKRK